MSDFSSFFAAFFKDVRNSGGMAGAFFLGAAGLADCSSSALVSAVGVWTDAICEPASPAIWVSQISSFAQRPNPVAVMSSQRMSRTSVPKTAPSGRHRRVTSPQPRVPPYQPDSAARRSFPPKTANKPRVSNDASSSARMRPHLIPSLPRLKIENPTYPIPATMSRLPNPNQFLSRRVSGVRMTPPARVFTPMSPGVAICRTMDSITANSNMNANATSATPSASRRKRPNCVLKCASRSRKSLWVWVSFSYCLRLDGVCGIATLRASC